MTPEEALAKAASFTLPVIYRRIIRYLSDNPNSDSAVLTAKCHTSKATMNRALSVMKNEWCIIHISGWSPTKKVTTMKPCYSLGSKKDKPRPAPLPASVKCKRWRDKVAYASTRPDRDKSGKLSLLAQAQGLVK